MPTELQRKWLQVLGTGKLSQPSTDKVGSAEGDTDANKASAKDLMSVNTVKADAAPAPGGPLGERDSAAPGGPSVRRLLISPIVSSIPVGTKQKFTATRLYSDKSTEVLKQAAWESSDPKVVSIDNTGEAIAKLVAGGTLKITATDKEFGESAFLSISTQRTKSIKTPAGNLDYFVDEEAIVTPLLEKATRTYAEAKSMEKSLEDAYKRMGEFESRINKVKDISKEVSTKADPESKQDAKMAELAKQDVAILKAILQKFMADLQQAQVNLQLDEKELESTQKKDRADSLRKKGQEQDKLLTFAIKTVGNIIGATVAISSGKPWGAAKPAWDEMGELVKLFHTNDFLAQAASLEKEARDIDLQNAAKRYQQAGIALKSAGEQFGQAQALAKRVEETYGVFSSEAEKKFDKTNRGGFQFEDLVKGIGWADATYDIAKETYPRAYTASQAAKALGRFGFPPEPGWNPPNPAAAKRMIDAVIDDAERLIDAAVKRRDAADALRKKLQAMYADAQKALVNSAGTGAPRAGK